MAKLFQPGENTLRSVLRRARQLADRGQLTTAAFHLGYVWPRLTSSMDSTTHEAADNLRVRLGIKQGP